MSAVVLCFLQLPGVTGHSIIKQPAKLRDYRKCSHRPQMPHEVRLLRPFAKLQDGTDDSASPHVKSGKHDHEREENVNLSKRDESIQGTLVNIPSGAQLLDATSAHKANSPLERMLQNLTFNYEVDSPTPPSCLPSCGRTMCIRYRCPHGHVVRCIANSAATKRCPSCTVARTTPSLNTSRKKLTLNDLQQMALEKGGMLLSTEYVNARALLTWRCAQRHIWQATAGNIRSRNSWCPECARQSRKLSLSDMHRLAETFDGECLSHQYISQHVKLQWRCRRGHIFWLAPNNIARSPGGKRKPTWCQLCRRIDDASSASKTLLVLQSGKSKGRHGSSPTYIRKGQN